MLKVLLEENEDNYLAYIKVKMKNDSLEIKAPTVANLEITELCNVKCKHCYNPWRDETMGINSLDLLKIKNDKTIKKLGVFHVVLSGGEPMSNFKVLKKQWNYYQKII